jgi:hypothetical protein
MLVGVAVLTGPRRADVAVGARLRDLTLLLAGLAFLQLVWGAALRHVPSPLVQRGHLLTAFAVVGVAAWLVRAALADPAARPRLATAAWLLVALLAVQVMLGVEAWMGKFAAGGLGELAAVTRSQAVVRTAHVLVGTGVLAASFVLALLAHLPAVAAQSTPVPLTIRDPRHLGETV